MLEPHRKEQPVPPSGIESRMKNDAAEEPDERVLEELRRRTADLEEELMLLKHSLDTLSAGITIADAEGRIRYLNAAGARMHGYDKEELVGRNVSVFMPDRTRLRRPGAEIATWKEWTREVLEARKDGTCFPARLTSVPVTSPDGTTHVITLSENITEQKLAQRALRESEERYRSLVESTDDSIYLVDRDCRYLFINRKHLVRMGLTEDAYMGRPYEDFHSEEETTWFRRMVERVCEIGKPIHIEHRGSPDARTFLLTFSPVCEAGGDVASVNVISKNITELKRLEEDLRSLSLSDELTGVYNRRGFFALAGQQIEIAHRHRKKICLLYVDVDGLKRVNDTLGHSAGDRLLMDAARLLLKVFRKSDIIARLGGDEFVVLSVQEPAESANAIALRLMENLAAFNAERASEPTLSLSAGVATCEAGTPCSIEQLLSLADRTMYQTKKRR